MLCGIAVMCGCGGSVTSSNELAYGKKYLYADRSIRDEDANYMIFDKDGTGINCVYSSGNDYYMFKFDYTIYDDTIVCTYKEGIVNNMPYDTDYEDWNRVINKFCENFLTINGQYGYNVYLNEDYVKTIDYYK